MGHELAVGGKAADCQPMWVTVWVRQLTHILTHTIFSVFATNLQQKSIENRSFRCFLELVV